MLNNPKHLVLEAPHPSPLSAYNGFFGSRPFSRTNRFLQERGVQPIDWQIENVGKTDRGQKIQTMKRQCQVGAFFIEPELASLYFSRGYSLKLNGSFFRGGQHQLDPVDLIHFTGSGIIIDGHDIGLRIFLLRSSLMTPLPTTWLGRHAKGWVHTMFGAPPWISSTISPVRNQPSPVWLPRETIGLAYSARS